jgi:uncharacterized protein YwgA
MEQKPKSDSEKVQGIIADAGGKIVGRTRLQKIAYLLEVAGVGDDFHFDYHHYGPYSEDLTRAASLAHQAEKICEEEKTTNWGGFYSIYTTEPSAENNEIRQRLAKTAEKADAVVLELAATAAYFAKDGKSDPWEETKMRKPDKAERGRLAEAKKLYGELRKISQKLPKI